MGMLGRPPLEGEEDLVGGFIAQHFAGARVELVLHFGDRGVGDAGKAGALGEVLPHEAVGVLVEPAFPGVIGPGEEKGGSQPARDLLMAGELLAIVGGDGVHPRLVGRSLVMIARLVRCAVAASSLCNNV